MADLAIRHVPGEASLGDAFAVRMAVFVDGQNVDEDLEMDGHDPDARHVVAYDGAEAVGTARLRSPDPGVAKVERVAVRAASRGEGVGTALMEAIEGVAREEGLDRAILNAQTRVEPFYAGLGYERVSNEVFEEAGIPHVKLAKPL